MPFDALYCSCLGEELNKYIGSRVDKVFRPDKTEFNFLIYAPDRTKKFLIISASMTSPRISVFDGDRERPSEPDSFVMLLRKHLIGARIVKTFAVAEERIICLDFDSADEMGYVKRKRIYAEIMGKHSNIILCDENDKVLAALYQTDITSPLRHIMTGLPYEPPPKQNKVSPFTVSKESFLAHLKENKGICADKLILNRYLAFSPLVSREVVYRACGVTDFPAGERDEDIYEAFISLISDVKNGVTKPCIVYGKEGDVLEISFTDITQYGDFKKEYPENLSEALNIYYEEKSAKEKIYARSKDLSKTVKNILSRLKKKLIAQTKDLDECAEREFCKQCGDAIIGSIYMLKQGMECAELMCYETAEIIKVRLEKNLSPSKNAERYYKKYGKLKRAETALKAQLKETKAEIEYIESVIDLISRLSTIEDFNEIRDELFKAGYLKGKRPALPKQRQKPLSFKTSGGFTVKVGKNNIQNDALTAGADKNDYWFHVKNYPGSHTILYTDGLIPSDEDLTEAATLAAKHSSASIEAGVLVDYTLIRYVKKPCGSKPGYVTYDKYKTALIKA